VFAEDYQLSNIASICNHYVAVTRGKNKLVIVRLNKYKADCFQKNLDSLFAQSGVKIGDVVSFH
jgi:cell shape-determining protein MreC